MPRLLLLRHAKAVSSQKDGPRDHDRPLSPEGQHECAEMLPLITGGGEQVDVVLCSTATRTRETWDGVRSAFPGEPEVRFLRDIFEADADYLSILRREGGAARSLLVVGHNPAIQATARTLADDIADGRGALLDEQFPTAALAVLAFEGDWRDLRGGAAHVATVLTTGDSDS